MTSCSSSDPPISRKLALASSVWGVPSVAGRDTSAELPSILLASLRFLLAGTVLSITRDGSRQFVATTEE